MSGLNELGLPALTHWVTEPCHAVAPGDWTTEHVAEVDCAGCLRELKAIEQRQIANRSQVHAEDLNDTERLL